MSGDKPRTGTAGAASDLERFFRVSPDLLCIVGLDGYLKRVAPAFCALLGYEAPELMASPVTTFLHPSDAEAYGSRFDEPATSFDPVTYEDRWRCADGSYRWLAWRALLYADEGLIYGVASDVTEDKRREEDLRRAKRTADAANRAKSEFLANMSHEIRTPMNGVIGMTELALETNLSDQQREYLQMVRNSATALLETINSILDFSKIEAGKMELESIDFTLWETVTGALKPLAIAARDKGVQLLYDEGRDVPERLRGDPGRLRQAMINLAGNAVKFTSEGTIRIAVARVPTDEAGVRLAFEVVDTGIGIPVEDVRRVFESFQQVDGSTTRLFGGTGLGLAITSGLVRLMDGELTVESEPGIGSTFRFSALFQDAGEPFRNRNGAGRLEGLRALIVDDQAANVRILRDFTERLGMEVSTAASGGEALRLLDEAYRGGRPIDVTMLDCRMPEMDGFELAERIRRDPRFGTLVMVAITAAGRPGDGFRCQELGIASYLLKPLAPWELRDALQLSLKPGNGGGPQRMLVTRHSLREARRRLRVLLAEDNHVSQQLAMHMLMRFGHTVHLARTGVEVLEALDTGRFDVVLMDVQMPEMDGITATAEIRRREAETGDGRRLPIVAMTAHAMVGDRERFLEAGMDDYVSKPISKDRLREVLRRIERAGLDDRPAASLSPPVFDAAAGSAPAAPSSTTAPRSKGPRQPDTSPRSFDRAELMERMESDVDLVRALVDVFSDDSDQLLEGIETALRGDDGPALERAAHTLKGAIAIFGAEPAGERAALLERLGRNGALAEARGEYGPLRDSVLVLRKDLAALLEELGSSRALT